MDALAHREAIGRRFGSRIASRDAVFLADAGTIGSMPCTIREDSVRPFGGINRFMLLQVMKDRAWQDPRFFTAAQVEKAGWEIKPNAKKIGLQFVVATGSDGLPLEVPTETRFHVFNATEIDGVPGIERATARGLEDLAEAAKRAGIRFDDANTLAKGLQDWLLSSSAIAGLAPADAALRVTLAHALVQIETGVSAPEIAPEVMDIWVETINGNPLLFARAVKDAELMAAHVFTELNIVRAERQAELDIGVNSGRMKAGASMGRQAGTTARVEALFADREAVLAVPYGDKDRASKLGAVWYPPQALWFVPKGIDTALFNEWNPRRNVLGAVATRDVLLASFREAMEDVGLVPPDEIKDDGKWHGTSVVCTKNPRNSKGTYIVTMDGARDGGAIGTVINKSTGERATWRYEGALLTPEQRARMRAEVMAREALAAAETLKAQDIAAEHAAEIWAVAGSAVGNAYARKKGILTDGLKQVEGAVLLKYAEFKSEAGASMIRARDQYLIVPMTTADGKLRAVQAIGPDGSVKSFMRGGQKKGTMFFLGMSSISDEIQELAYVEGVSTGVSLHQSTGLPVVVCFDAGNLETVVVETSPRLPASVSRLLAVDNDQFHVERALSFVCDKLGVNPSAGGTAFVKVASGAGKLRDVPLGEAVADGQWHQTARGTYCMTLTREDDSDAVRSIAVEIVPEKGRKIEATFVNRGVEAGRTARLAVLSNAVKDETKAPIHVEMMMPEFQSLAGRPTDWNDLETIEGGEAVRRAARRSGVAVTNVLLPDLPRLAPTAKSTEISR